MVRGVDGVWIVVCGGRWIVEYVVRGVGRRALWEGVDGGLWVLEEGVGGLAGGRNGW